MRRPRRPTGQGGSQRAPRRHRSHRCRHRHGGERPPLAPGPSMRPATCPAPGVEIGVGCVEEGGRLGLEPAFAPGARSGTAAAGQRGGGRHAPAERRSAHLLGPAHERPGARDVGERRQHGEFVATCAIKAVGLAKHGAQGLHQGHQRRVTGGMALGVVDELEPVHVDQDKGHVQSRALGARQGAGEFLVESAPVGATGKRIDPGRAAEIGGRRVDHLQHHLVEQPEDRRRRRAFRLGLPGRLRHRLTQLADGLKRLHRGEEPSAPGPSRPAQLRGAGPATQGIVQRFDQVGRFGTPAGRRVSMGATSPLPGVEEVPVAVARSPTCSRQRSLRNPPCEGLTSFSGFLPSLYFG